MRGGATYTFDSVQIFRQQFPTAELWWLLGMDSLLKLHTWTKWQTLVRQTNIAVANRNGGRLAQAPCELHGWLGEALQNGSLHLLQAPLLDISSSDIRGRLKNGLDAAEMLDGNVWHYIRKHKLYAE